MFRVAISTEIINTKFGSHLWLNTFCNFLYSFSSLFWKPFRKLRSDLKMPLDNIPFQKLLDLYTSNGHFWSKKFCTKKKPSYDKINTLIISLQK